MRIPFTPRLTRHLQEVFVRIEELFKDAPDLSYAFGNFFSSDIHRKWKQLTKVRQSTLNSPNDSALTYSYQSGIVVIDRLSNAWLAPPIDFIDFIRQTSFVSSTTIAGGFEDSLIQHITYPSESLQQPARGDLYTLALIIIILTHATQPRGPRSGEGLLLKCFPKTYFWKYLIFIDWTSCSSPVRGSGTASHTSVENGALSFPCRHVV